MSRRQNPSEFLKQIIGKPVVVKLNSGVDYRGILACLDGRVTRFLSPTVAHAYECIFEHFQIDFTHMATHLLGQPQQLTPQQIMAQDCFIINELHRRTTAQNQDLLMKTAHEDFMKLFDRGALQVETDKDSLKRPLPAAFTQFDPASKRPLPIVPQQMQNNMLTHQQLMQQAAIQAAMQARTMPSTAQNSYLQAPPHLRPLDGTAPQQLRPLDPSQQLRPLDTSAAQQMRQMDQTAAAAAAATQQYRAHEQAVAQQLQRQLPPQMLQNQAALQMRNQQMTVQEYHNLLRLTQPTAMPQRRQTIGGTNISPQFFIYFCGCGALHLRRTVLLSSASGQSN
ncbi:hypothetical protein Y032_0002g961 [Ancylostoma ceylanicum]|uniref:Uncharacterized protein n=2 Tax=Ancylostoma ceylanicum TaxID=53326 RepID=A0A016W412_9BILA|nr:hypothetical protein Y032_0002g961 [Ancylostoma ceylanicum]